METNRKQSNSNQIGKYRYHRLYWFLLLNFFLTLILAAPYLSYAPEASSLQDWLFVRIAFVSNFAMIYIVLGIFLLLLAAVVPFTSFMIISSTILLWIFNILVFVDVNIFKLFRFHLNSMIWNVLVTEGSGDSVKLGAGTWTTFSLIVIVILGLEISAHYGLWRLIKKIHLKKSGYAVAGLVCLTIILIDKGVYAYGDLYNMTYITRYAKLFPLYQPLTIKKFAKKKLGFKINRELELNRDEKQGILNYPLSELKFHEPAEKKNFVVIAIESWRYDMLSPEVTPNIYAFSKGNWVFKNHYSGGNASRFGIFALFYGLYGNYWHHFLSERAGPVLIHCLKEQGYAMKILSSTQFTFPEFRKTAFVEIPECIEDNLEGEEGRERDPVQAVRLKKWLDSLSAGNPFFAFLFFDAPHAPYSYPEDFTKFKPAVPEVNFIHIDKKKNMEPILNRYKNAVYFDDAITGEILNILEEKGLLESTVVIITGDHGEEFYERGFWGHNGAFSPEQVKVPFVLHLPGSNAGTVEALTSHYDVPATILDLMGCVTPPEQYSLGCPLNSSLKQRPGYVVSSSWDECAVIASEATLIFSTEVYNISTFEVRDKDYKFVPDTQPYLKSRVKDLSQIMFKMAKFLK
ncbi:MAG: DUF3413 domain-containing protein [bacterium]|nr:DUF3413 domain-containing protein [bacterium]